LWAITACCSLGVERETALVLALRACGLTDEEIAARFLSGRALIEQLESAPRSLDDNSTSMLISGDDRTPTVIHVIYLLFTTGYQSLSRSGEERCAHAIVLARTLRAALRVGDSDLDALLALMLFHHARRGARCDSTGALVLLRDQVRDSWDQTLIDEGFVFLDSASCTKTDTSLVLQARIAAVHVTAKHAERTDWTAIVELYGQLYSIEPSAPIALNRAIAISMVKGPAVALGLVDSVRFELDAHHAWHAARADLLLRLERDVEAINHFRIALALTPDEAERAYFATRIAESELVADR
jgi:RNA polymerase sigma-70 factor (ECF subfamily)